MKNFIIISILAIVLFGAVGVYAAAISKVNVSSYTIVGDAYAPNAVKKFVDGNYVCYTFQVVNNGSISCVKK